MSLAGHLLADWLRGTPVVRSYWAIAREVERGTEFLVRLRRRRLGRLLIEIRERYPIYMDMIGNVPADALEREPEYYLSLLPIVGKDEIEKLWMSDLQGDRAFGGRYEGRFTGGSTGRPFRYELTKGVIARQRGYAMYFWTRFGYRPGERYAVVGGRSMGRGGGIRVRVYEALVGRERYRATGSNLNDVATSLREAIRRGGVRLVYGYPSLLAALAGRMGQVGEGKLLGVFTTSEMLTGEMRRHIADGFGCAVYDMYGANDGGIVSCECPEQKGWHYNMQDCVVEVEDPDGEGVGELVLTNLLERRRPFVRYRVGDLGALAWQRCECGWGLPRVTRLRGRTRDVVRTGNRVIHGSAFNALLAEMREIRRYQVVVEGRRVCVRVVPRGERLAEETERRVRERFGKLLGGEFEVAVSQVSERELLDGEKFQTVVVRGGGEGRGAP